ncbi:hypothetical protein HN51_047077 [Arachis hypogaea]
MEDVEWSEEDEMNLGQGDDGNNNMKEEHTDDDREAEEHTTNMSSGAATASAFRPPRPKQPIRRPHPTPAPTPPSAPAPSLVHVTAPSWWNILLVLEKT